MQTISDNRDSECNTMSVPNYSMHLCTLDRWQRLCGGRLPHPTCSPSRGGQKSQIIPCVYVLWIDGNGFMVGVFDTQYVSHTVLEKNSQIIPCTCTVWINGKGVAVGSDGTDYVWCLECESLGKAFTRHFRHLWCCDSGRVHVALLLLRSQNTDLGTRQWPRFHCLVCHSSTRVLFSRRWSGRR